MDREAETRDEGGAETSGSDSDEWGNWETLVQDTDQGDDPGGGGRRRRGGGRRRRVEEVPQYPPPAPTTGDLHISSPTTSEVEEPMIASSPAEEA